MSELTPIIKDSFLQFAGAVLQSRALVDSRDCVKPSARQIFYCMYTDKFVHDKPFQKTLKSIGSCFRLYIHGDKSAEGVIMRAGQPFAYRYPLVEVEGSYGTLLSSESWSAPRYTSARLSPLAEYLFADMDKDTIAEWRDNYDNTEKYPAVLPSKGFFNLVNGSMGIGVGASSSIPQYNLRELNEALIKLLYNPDISFNEIYCVPDFATGAILINPEQVKQSHRDGTGFACKLRSVVDWDKTEKCFCVTEIPYMLYTDTICEELENIINGEDNPGIIRFNDLTGAAPCIKIYLDKTANPDKVLKYLYKNTSLENYYGVNFTMLENGRFPRQFTWKELLQSHLNHELEVYRRGYEYDLAKIKARLHILDGLLKAIDMMDAVIHTIKTAADSKAASAGLQKLLSIDADQAKAILDLKLARLANLEVNKLVNEQRGLQVEQSRIETILSDELKLKDEIANGLREVAKKFGDSRRTKVVDLMSTTNDEPVEIKQLQVSLTNQNNIFVQESSTLYTQKRGSVGAKLKMSDGEYIITTCAMKSNANMLLFSTKGQVYQHSLTNIDLDTKLSLYPLISLADNDTICALASQDMTSPYICFVTKHGYIKKSETSEYTASRRNSGIKGLTLEEGDAIADVLFLDNEQIGIATHNGNFLYMNTEDIRPIGRATRGVAGIKLKEGDYVVSAHIIPHESQFIVSISANGLFKKTTLSEFTVRGRATLGTKIQSLGAGDYLADVLPITNQSTILVAATHTCLRVNVSDIPQHLCGAQGVKAIKLAAGSQVIRLSTDS